MGCIGRHPFGMELCTTLSGLANHYSEESLSRHKTMGSAAGDGLKRLEAEELRIPYPPLSFAGYPKSWRIETARSR